MQDYQFSHLISSSRTHAGNIRTRTWQYTTQPFDHFQPEIGKEVHSVICNRCGREVKVTMLSNKEIWKKKITLLPLLPGFALLWFLLELAPKTSAFGKFVTSIEGILGIITFFACAWALGRLFEDKRKFMFETDSTGHEVLWHN